MINYFIVFLSLFKPNHRQISHREATAIIDFYQLQPYLGMWHYSYHLDLLKPPLTFLRQGKEIYIYADSSLDNWSPLPVYTNSKSLPQVIKSKKRAILKPVNRKEIQGDRKYFWWIKTDDFNDFLAYRNRISSQPRKNFPSTYTYPQAKAKLNCQLKIVPWQQEFFTEHYNRLKKPNHAPAEQTYLPSVAKEWLKIAYLETEGQVNALAEQSEAPLLAIALIIDDGKSICLSNIASEYISGRAGYGLFLCTEVLRYCCEHNYQSLDAGISGVYGGYKSKLFCAYQVK